MNIMRIRCGVQRTWPQWLSYEKDGELLTTQGILRVTTDEERREGWPGEVLDCGGSPNPYYSLGSRAYPVLDLLPGRLHHLIKTPAQQETLLKHVIMDIMSICSSRTLSVEVEGVTDGSKRRAILPGTLHKGDLLHLLRNRFEPQHLPAAVLSSMLAFVLAANLMRKLSTAQTCRAVRLCWPGMEENFGLDEDGLVMLIHESLHRFVREMNKAEWSDQVAESELWDVLKVANGGQLKSTSSDGMYNVYCRSDIVAHVDHDSDSGVTWLRTPERRLIQRWRLPGAAKLPLDRLRDRYNITTVRA